MVRERDRDRDIQRERERERERGGGGRVEGVVLTSIHYGNGFLNPYRGMLNREVEGRW